jgi:hypothetical protein
VLVTDGNTGLICSALAGNNSLTRATKIRKIADRHAGHNETGVVGADDRGHDKRAGLDRHNRRLTARLRTRGTAYRVGGEEDG